MISHDCSVTIAFLVRLYSPSSVPRAFLLVFSGIPFWCSFQFYFCLICNVLWGAYDNTQRPVLSHMVDISSTPYTWLLWQRPLLRSLLPRGSICFDSALFSQTSHSWLPLAAPLSATSSHIASLAAPCSWSSHSRLLWQCPLLRGLLAHSCFSSARLFPAFPRLHTVALAVSAFRRFLIRLRFK